MYENVWKFSFNKIDYITYYRYDELISLYFLDFKNSVN